MHSSGQAEPPDSQTTGDQSHVCATVGGRSSALAPALWPRGREHLPRTGDSESTHHSSFTETSRPTWADPAASWPSGQQTGAGFGSVPQTVFWVVRSL